MSMNVGDSAELIHGGGGGGLRNFWRSRTDFEKRLLITLTVMTLVVIGMTTVVVVLAIQNAKKNPSTNANLAAPNSSKEIIISTRMVAVTTEPTAGVERYTPSMVLSVLTTRDNAPPTVDVQSYTPNLVHSVSSTRKNATPTVKNKSYTTNLVLSVLATRHNASPTVNVESYGPTLVPSVLATRVDVAPTVSMESYTKHSPTLVPSVLATTDNAAPTLGVQSYTKPRPTLIPSALATRDRAEAESSNSVTMTISKILPGESYRNHSRVNSAGELDVRDLNHIPVKPGSSTKQQHFAEDLSPNGSPSHQESYIPRIYPTPT